MNLNFNNSIRNQVLLFVIGLFIFPNLINAQVKYTEVIDSLPVRKTLYRIRVPENRNGRLISDFAYYDAYIHVIPFFWAGCIGFLSRIF